LGTLREIVKGVFIGLSINGAMGFIHFIANYLGLDSPFEFLLMEMPIWVSVTIFIIVIPTVAFYIRSKYTSRGFISVVRRRPEDYDFTLKYICFGVVWKILGVNRVYSTEPYIYCEPHPYCPECDYEMEAERIGLLKRYFWRCYKCGKSYKCSIDPYKASEIVEKLVESDIRTGKIKISS